MKKGKTAFMLASAFCALPFLPYPAIGFWTRWTTNTLGISINPYGLVMIEQYQVYNFITWFLIPGLMFAAGTLLIFLGAVRARIGIAGTLVVLSSLATFELVAYLYVLSLGSFDGITANTFLAGYNGTSFWGPGVGFFCALGSVAFGLDAYHVTMTHCYYCDEKGGGLKVTTIIDDKLRQIRVCTDCFKCMSKDIIQGVEEA
nr:hypothetical protein [Candidatus Sigynarchaeota archaeon]